MMSRSREQAAGGAVSGAGCARAPVVWLSRRGAAHELGSSGFADDPELPPGRPAPAIPGVSSS